VTPRAVDWSLALVVWALFATGVLSLYTGRGDQAWIFVAHGALGFALAALLVWKLRRVWHRIVDTSAWDERTGAGLAALLVVTVALVSGWVWSSGGELIVGGYNLLGWHMALGTALVAVVVLHAALRRKPLRARDVAAGRRQFFAAAGVAAGAFALWQVQRPVSAFFGLRGAKRRFTGSFERGSFAGNEGFPPTSWIADRPRVVDDPAYRLRVDGLVRSPLSLAAADLDAGDSVDALLDCTGGWYSRQRWSGVRLDRLIARAGARTGAHHVRVESHTGYRWSFPLSEAPKLLIATRVGGQPLSHGHGAPARLVAPGRRGFQWVKWVVRIELIEQPDLGAPASTVWSSGTPEGRGEA
jgi:DMSO/TMAO reductase YedYZ molybdopterin-dependent catalytic subunit